MKLADTIKEKPLVGWGILLVVMAGVFCLGLLSASITERRAEVATLFSNKKVEIKGIESRNALWGQNYPREYATWLKTREMDFKSKHHGNHIEDGLEGRPNMVVLWAGYLFSRSYNAPRGHMYAVEDVRASLRIGTPEKDTDGPQSSTCWSCKSPDVPRLMKEMGVAKFYESMLVTTGSEVVNPIGCADCHDPAAMNLTLTRPYLTEALARMGKDWKTATTQEMRSLVCAQCHSEYYFNGPGKIITFPWDKGLTVEQQEAYYDDIKFSDWTHALSKTPMIKPQHPDYELFVLGPHGQRGLACADCHMPYISEGGIKYSNHQVMSPLKNVAGSCQVCHRDSEENLKKYVYEYQDKAMEIRNRVEQELVKAHIMAKAAWDKEATAEEMAPVLKLIRSAGWRWDFAVASHGGPFHAPVEIQRILAHALDKSMQAQLALQKILNARGVTDVPMPDLSTKAKAQAYIGLDMTKLNADKAAWMKKVPPQWLEEAKKKGRL